MNDQRAVKLSEQGCMESYLTAIVEQIILDHTGEDDEILAAKIVRGLLGTLESPNPVL